MLPEQENQQSQNIRQYSLNDNYLKEITMIPKCICCSCDKSLFESQVYCCRKSVEDLVLTVGDTLCCNCHRQLLKNEYPNRCFIYNNLYAGVIPRQLQNMTLIEKRLISQVNIFFTLLILPCYPVG